MRISITIKALLRSPIRTILTFVLLGVVIFALFSQSAEYAITAREFDKASGQYSGVGTSELAPPEFIDTIGLPVPYWGEPYFKADLDIDYFSVVEPYKDTYQRLTQEEVGDIASLPYISSVDKRYMTAGISDELFRLDDGSHTYSFTSRCVVEATLAECEFGNQPNPSILTLSDYKVLAGVLPMESEDGLIVVEAVTSQPSDKVRAYSDNTARPSFVWTANYKYLTEYLQNHITPGKRYVFTLRYESLNSNFSYFLYDYLAEPWCEAIMEITDADYPGPDQYAPLRELIEITNSDIHTFDMVYTEDMESIIRFALGKMAIIDGRALDAHDSETGARVCVISRELADAYNLKVGDSIEIHPGSKLFEQYKGLGALAVYPERYEPHSGATALRIAGVYTDTDGILGQSMEPNWSYSVNTIFVPKSLLTVPEDELAAHQYTPAEFSFTVGNAWDIPAFLEETRPVFEQMGLTLIFDDGGWNDIAGSFLSVKRVSVLRIVILTCAAAAATCLTVYLFIGRKKKEYAIMRALGAAKKASALAMLIPLMLVASTSMIAGVASAWIYVRSAVSQNAALAVLEGITIDASVPAGVIIGCVLGELALTAAVSLILLRFLSAQPPLALIQGEGAKRFPKPKKTISEQTAGSASPRRISSKAGNIPVERSIADSAAERSIAEPPAERSKAEPAAASSVGMDYASKDGATQMDPAERKSRAHRFIISYIYKHIRRVAWKSVMMVLISALLLAVVGQLANMRRSYAGVYEDTVIVADVAGGVHLSVINRFMDSGYVDGLYYACSESVDVETSLTQIVVTNNIPRFTGEDTDIVYAEGYDATVMDSFGDVIIIGASLMERYNVELGGTVAVLPPGAAIALNISTVARYRGDYPDDPISDEDILELRHSEIMGYLANGSYKFKVVGVVSTPSGNYDKMAFTPGTTNLSIAYGQNATLDIAQFELADNYRAEEFRKFGEAEIGASISTGIRFIMDTSKLENLENSMNLLKVLYPMALAAALLLSGFLCSLSTLQSSREAAIMRVLGTTKRKARVILTAEAAVLDIAGLVLGLCAMFIIHGRELAAVIDMLYLYCALQLVMILVCTAICSALVTRRNVLELLHAKE